ncbi:TPA: Flp pilus assembly complex ATPase component TadA [Pseudomonas aeruginosa]|uniref:GspE/PulE family protein n=1 Tax=Pseudomonas aeruginosa TaxID=287 RepID=UPI0021CACEE7|nr:ATPase, T2SS/T4P/T4SS family [Pseudomonas aeruginosa]HDZ3359586.1 Flp pilus assembly complex ATPase component TadA [Pseudomonas aeruginosa]
MNAVSGQPNIKPYLDKWRFDESAPNCIKLHAARCAQYKGLKVGQIVIALELAPKEDVERCIAMPMPVGTKTLDWLRTNGVRNITLRKDEILCISNGDAYMSEHCPEMTVHSVVAEMEDGTNKQRLLEENSRHGFIPLSYGQRQVLLFNDHDKYLEFKTGDKHARDQLEFVKQLKKSGGNPRLDEFLWVVGSDAASSEYRKGLSSDNGDDDGFSASQYITELTAKESVVLDKFVNIINQGLAQECNDVALEPHREQNKTFVYFRQYQRLVKTNIELSGSERDDLIRVLATRSKANKGMGKITQPRDGNLIFTGKNGSAFLRLSFIPLENSKGESISVSIRLLPRDEKVISLEKLNIPEPITEILKFCATRSRGLFLVCGPTNSGKSTTVGGMLCHNNDVFSTSLKRMSIEQPVERFLPNTDHVDVSQLRFEHKGTDNFFEALRAFLRHDPDVINVGEIRDTQSCGVTVDAAKTGHLVTATTHANDPVMGFRRLASFLPPQRIFDLVSVLMGILAQRLVKCVCKKCKVEKEFDEKSRKLLRLWAKNNGVALPEESLPETYVTAKKGGCKECVDGYSSMRPIHGLLLMNPEIRALLLSKDENDWMKAQALSDQEFSLFNAAFELFKAHKIDLETLML